MNLHKRLREIEEVHGVGAQRGPWEARKRAAIYDLRHNPDLELVEREDCDPGPEGTRLYNRIRAKIALAEGDVMLAQVTEAWEQKFGADLGFGPAPTPEEQERAEREAALNARARVQREQRSRRSQSQ